MHGLVPFLFLEVGSGILGSENPLLKSSLPFFFICYNSKRINNKELFISKKLFLIYHL